MAFGRRGLARVAVLALAAGVALAQRPGDEAWKKTVRDALAADAAGFPGYEAKLAAAPPLSKADAKAWVDFVRKEIAGSAGPRLEAKGTSYFYDRDDRAKRRGKYIVSGAENTKGLVFGLHGGGEGSADCGPAASAFRGCIGAAGMIGIYPEAVEATEAAWGDDVTVAFMLDLLAAARRTFRFDPERVYVVGHSMGGYGAWTWGGRFSDRLAGCASFAGSPTPIFEDGDRSKPVVAIQPGVLPNFRNVPLWVYHSQDDRQVPWPSTKFATDALKVLAAENPGAYALVYEEVENRGHAFPAKGPGPAMEWLAKRARVSRPARVAWEAFYERPDASYWLWWERPRRGARIDGEIRATPTGAAIAVTGDAEAVDVAALLDDALCDLDKPVTLTVGGRKTFEGVPRRTLLEIVRSARRRNDPGLLYTARVP
ncbi:MAG TPA: alpha/beta fold hydrolase [Planctomycetota bacterium]|nr:alpha/beta fold hydrolase [Planctomycetota bacterium]